MAKPTVRRFPLCSKGLYSASEKGRFPINGGEEEKKQHPRLQTDLALHFSSEVLNDTWCHMTCGNSPFPILRGINGFCFWENVLKPNFTLGYPDVSHKQKNNSNAIPLDLHWCNREQNVVLEKAAVTLWKTLWNVLFGTSVLLCSIFPCTSFLPFLLSEDSAWKQNRCCFLRIYLLCTYSPPDIIILCLWHNNHFLQWTIVIPQAGLKIWSEKCILLWYLT